MEPHVIPCCPCCESLLLGLAIGSALLILHHSGSIKTAIINNYKSSRITVGANASYRLPDLSQVKPVQIYSKKSVTTYGVQKQSFYALGCNPEGLEPIP